MKPENRVCRASDTAHFVVRAAGELFNRNTQRPRLTDDGCTRKESMLSSPHASSYFHHEQVLLDMFRCPSEPDTIMTINSHSCSICTSTLIKIFTHSSAPTAMLYVLGCSPQSHSNRTNRFRIPTTNDISYFHSFLPPPLARYHIAAADISASFVFEAHGT